MEGQKEEEGIMPSLVAATSALAHTTCMRMHFVHTHVEIPFIINQKGKFNNHDDQLEKENNMVIKFNFTIE